MKYNENSHICEYIYEHPATWDDDFTKMHIRMSGEENGGYWYMIFNYYNGCDFREPVVQEARGVIIDIDRLEVVCWPFRKFGNFLESYADPIRKNIICLLVQSKKNIIS